MKKLIAGLVVVAAIVAIFFTFRSTHQYKPLTNVLIVGTSADFPPFSFRSADDTIAGFDIDVVKEVAERVGLKVELQDKPFGTLLPQMELGQIHAIAAGMTPTEERAKRVFFTKPFLGGNPLLIVTRARDPKIFGLEDLKDKQVLVNTGYTADIYLSTLPEIDLLRLPRVADALTSLEQGNGHAFVTAAFTLQPYVQEGDKRFNVLRILEKDEQSALALAPHLPDEFKEKVQRALDDMEADGTLDSLKKKWKVV